MSAHQLPAGISVGAVAARLALTDDDLTALERLKACRDDLRGNVHFGPDEFDSTHRAIRLLRFLRTGEA